jgi:hypothetical protein
LFSYNSQSVSHAITNAEAQAGKIRIPLDHFDSGVYLLDIELYAASSANLGNGRIPLRSYFDYTFQGGGHSSSFEHTGSLEQIDNGGPWYYGDTIRLRTNFGTLTGVDLVIYWGPLKIPENTSINVTISYVLLSETDPS